MSWLVWEMTKPLQGVMGLWGVLSFSMVLWRKPHGLWWTLTGNDWWVDDLVGWSLMKMLFRGLTALKSKYIKETAIRLMDVGGSRVPRRKPTISKKNNEVFPHQNHVMWATQPWSTIWKFGHGLDHPSKWWRLGEAIDIICKSASDHWVTSTSHQSTCCPGHQPARPKGQVPYWLGTTPKNTWDGSPKIF